MDWRELDKFVASQLSPDQESLGEAQNVNQLEIGTEDVNRFSGFLLSPDSEIGASAFE